MRLKEALQYMMDGKVMIDSLDNSPHRIKRTVSGMVQFYRFREEDRLWWPTMSLNDSVKCFWREATALQLERFGL